MFERFEVLLSDLLPRVDSDLLNNMHRVDDMIFRNVSKERYVIFCIEQQSI